jgi:hypothetical protein
MRWALAEVPVKTIANHRLVAGLALLLAVEALLLLAGSFIPIEPLLHGWLVAFAIWSSVPIGSMALLMIHRLTGGGWGVVAAPVLCPAAAMTPFALLAFVPILVALPHVYPWAADPSPIPADVAHWYLNAPSFWIRAVIALGGWSLLGVAFAAGLGSRLLAGLGLAFFGLTISLIAVDWYLSLDPRYEATAFPAMIAIQQLLAALAIAALMGPPTIKGKIAGDIGGLLIATLLGVVYLELMTFVVAWYGDLPDKAEWFLKRASSGWLAVLVLALITGAAAPFGMLLVKAIRRSRRGLRMAGLLILFGSVLHIAWLLVPDFTAQAGVALVATVGCAILLVVSWLLGSGLALVLEASRAQ